METPDRSHEYNDNFLPPLIVHLLMTMGNTIVCSIVWNLWLNKSPHTKHYALHVKSHFMQANNNIMYYKTVCLPCNAISKNTENIIKKTLKVYTEY